MKDFNHFQITKLALFVILIVGLVGCILTGYIEKKDECQFIERLNPEMPTQTIVISERYYFIDGQPAAEVQVKSGTNIHCDDPNCTDSTILSVPKVNGKDYRNHKIKTFNTTAINIVQDVELNEKSALDLNYFDKNNGTSVYILHKKEWYRLEHLVLISEGCYDVHVYKTKDNTHSTPLYSQSVNDMLQIKIVNSEA